jgi:hypothetical protein
MGERGTRPTGMETKREKKHPSDTLYVYMHDTEIDRDAANTNFLHNSQAERLGTT